MTTTQTSILVCLLATAFAGCARRETPRPTTLTPVRVKVVTQPEARGATRYSGTIAPAAQVDMLFKVGGYVREVAEAKGLGRKLQEGDFVTKGTVLAVINDADYRQRLSAAQASYAEALASEKQSSVDFERSKSLLAADVINKADHDGALAKRDVAVARTAAARAKVSEAALAVADCTLRAPFDGVVIRRTVEVGALAAPGSPAFVIADTRTVKVSFGAPDVLLGSLHMGDALEVRLEALGRKLSGEITRIAPSADSKSRTFDVEATLANGDDTLKVGMIASIHIAAAATAAAEPRASLALPLTAVVRAPKDPRGFAVFVIEKQAEREVARVRTVQLGDVVGSAVQVVAGVAPGERVIESGATLVTDGEIVRVVR